jgi:hypothetical protein
MMMEITIDTSKDSSEDIKKAIEFLRSFVDGKRPSVFDIPQETGPGAMGIFSDSGEKDSSTLVKDKKSSKIDDDGLTIIPY